MTKYAVIGSNCFTGSHMVDALLADNETHEVLGMSRSSEYADLFLPYKQHQTERFQFKQLDLVREMGQVLAVLDEFQPDIVIFVAALSEVGLSNFEPIEYYDVNVKAVVQLCDHLRQQKYLQHYVHVSSAEIFGTCSDLVDEESPFYPSTPYAVSKAAADMHLETLRKNHQFPAIIVRSTNVYGQHQQLFKIIPRTVIRIKQGEILELHGGGQSRKSFIHVRDVVRGMLAAIKHGEPTTWNFSEPSDLTVAEIVQKVCLLMEADFEKCTRTVGERLGQDAAYQLNCAQAVERLQWKPEESMDAAILETIEWIESNWDEIQNLPHEYQHRIN